MIEESRESRLVELRDKLTAASKLLSRTIETYHPKMVVALMSGGDDSLPATMITSFDPNFSGVLHINTGIGIEQTREYVRKFCRDSKWKLWEYKAEENRNVKGEPDPQSYEEIVLRYGFPGPGSHNLMYARLKERQLRLFERDHGFTTKHPVLYVTGSRQQESRRRMLNVPKNAVTKKGRQVWLNVILDWSSHDCADFREIFQLPRNEVAALIHMSGECLCGAFAHPGELDEIACWFPETAQYIRDLEIRVKANGFPWGWGEEPPEWWEDHKRGQTFLNEYLPLCHSCPNRGLSLERDRSPVVTRENKKSCAGQTATDAGEGE